MSILNIYEIRVLTYVCNIYVNSGMCKVHQSTPKLCFTLTCHDNGQTRRKNSVQNHKGTCHGHGQRFPKLVP